MPEEIEVPTEQLHETMHEKAEEAEERGHGRWVAQVAISSALIAVAAAIASLLAGHHANEAMLEQMQATDQWAFYQAKGIKSAVLESKLQLLEAFGKDVKSEERARLDGYEGEKKKIEETGHEMEASSRRHMERHNVLARAVTVFQIAIAMAAIAVLARRRPLWWMSMALGVAGAWFLFQGVA
jgi:hypothetical protein